MDNNINWEERLWQAYIADCVKTRANWRDEYKHCYIQAKEYIKAYKELREDNRDLP